MSKFYFPCFRQRHADDTFYFPRFRQRHANGTFYFPRFRQRHADAIIRNVETIVKLSSVVRKSLTHLDLSLCEYSIFTGKRKNTAKLEINYFIYDDRDSYSKEIEISNDFLCTGKNWERILEKDKRLLHIRTSYTCNVDLITGRFHYSEDLITKPFKYCRILIPRNFYEDLLPRFIEFAKERIYQTKSLTMARKILKPLKSIIYLNNNNSFVENLAHIFYSESVDLNIWQEFFSSFRIEEHILFSAYRCYTPEVIERLLYYACLSGFNFKQNSLNRDLILHCFPTAVHSKVKVLLKFISAPRYCPYTHQQCRSDLYNRRDHLGLVNAMQLVREKPSNKERSFLMLQVIHAFLLYNTKGRHALRLIWRCIPDAYITKEEMTDQYEEIITARHLTDIWNFYRGIVGDDCSCLKPRSLQHYSRVSIRTALSDNGQLYEGIDKLVDLHSCLKLFLKLAE